jgi:hypothetical protein
MDKQNQKEQKEKKKINKHEFYFETPLYEIIEVSRLEEDLFKGDVDAYNFASGFDTTYKIEIDRISDYQWSAYYHFYTITLTCKRNEKDKLRFFVYYDGEVVMKVGQIPSLADIQFAEIGKKYDRFLSKEELKEFKKSIDLAAHGHGAGSFVYLRRIFENLINAAFRANRDSLGISEKDFQKMWMVDKVERLKNYLPSQLLEMKSIYKVLSKGVHELSEQECLRYFPALKLSIELILEQKIEEEIKRKRDAEVKQQLEDIAREINDKKQTN